jgi:hypothetical protein
MTQAAKPRLHAHRHAVQFYGDDASLITTVGGFLGEGLVNGHPSIVIATQAHNAAIAKQLASRLIDVDAATKSGDLQFLDAEATLATFMDGEMPQAAKFEYHVGGFIERALGARANKTIVHAYGEMVDILWKQGSEEAAIRLEILWNKLAHIYGFALLCGYSMGNFYKQAERFQDVCRQHTHVFHSDENVVIFDKKKHLKTA